MAVNTTVLLSLTNETIPALLLSEELAREINRILNYVVLPCISVLAIMGNVSNIVILTRQGFRKSSNILLLSLAVSDILLAFGLNNIPRCLYAENIPPGFQFSESVNYICFVLYEVASCVSNAGIFSAVLIPVLITGERIVTIFCPFKSPLILTPRRMIIAVTCFYVAAGVYFLYTNILSRQFKQSVLHGVSMGLFIGTDMFQKHYASGLYQLIDQIVNYMTGIVPISLVTVGCVVIGLKIIQITSRRRQLTFSQGKVTTRHGITKTTRTLLSICVLYIFCYGFAFIVSDLVKRKPLENQRTLQIVIFRVLDLVFCINCLGDFLIYFSANNRFGKPNIVGQRIKT